MSWRRRCSVLLFVELWSNCLWVLRLCRPVSVSVVVPIVVAGFGRLDWVKVRLDRPGSLPMTSCLFVIVMSRNFEWLCRAGVELRCIVLLVVRVWLVYVVVVMDCAELLAAECCLRQVVSGCSCGRASSW